MLCSSVTLNVRSTPGPELGKLLVFCPTAALVDAALPRNVWAAAVLPSAAATWRAAE
jgi:hypothetical protein